MDCPTDSTDRPALAITPAMIEAGADALASLHEASAVFQAEAAYRAMEAARSRCAGVGGQNRWLSTPSV